MNTRLIGNASTQSRSRRPLPLGAISAMTLATWGAHERVQFRYSDGSSYVKEFLSWIIGQAGLLHGAGPFPQSIENAMEYIGCHGSYGHAYEETLAEVLCEVLDGLFTSDSLACRFGLNGRDALDAAARVARAATGREVLASFGYHGAGESWVHPPYPEGIPLSYRALNDRFEWGDTSRMRMLARECAAICVEVPAMLDAEIFPFLQACREACDAGGAIFILDEVVTGFRLSLRGAAAYYNVKPDIACYGKCLSATGAVSAIVGRRDLVNLLDRRVFFSLTFGGQPSSCAVALATIHYLQSHPEIYDHIWHIGHLLKDGFHDLGIPCIGQDVRFNLLVPSVRFPNESDRLEFCSRMIEHGIMVGRPFFPVIPHTQEDVNKTIEAAAKAIDPCMI